MTYSYSGPLTYGPQDPSMMHSEMAEKKPSSVPYGIGGAVAGVAVGGFIAGKKNPFVSKDGVANDSFTRSVLEKSIAAAPETDKKVYDQSKNILKGIEKVKTVAELQTMFNENKDAVNKVMGDTTSFLQNVTEQNLETNKAAIKNKFIAEEKTLLQDVKNKIQSCWKLDSKKFEKADSVTQEFFDAIKKSTNGVKAKMIAKYAAIAGASAGIAGFVAHKLLSGRKASGHEEVGTRE